MGLRKREREKRERHREEGHMKTQAEIGDFAARRKAGSHLKLKEARGDCLL